jgi:hypothetical protein
MPSMPYMLYQTLNVSSFLIRLSLDLNLTTAPEKGKESQGDHGGMLAPQDVAKYILFGSTNQKRAREFRRLKLTFSFFRRPSHEEPD